ncbi:MAG: hypothetical protein ACE5I1_18255 [bacterium]
MKKNNTSVRAVENELQKTLQALDYFEKVKASPFFYTRLRQRLDAIGASNQTAAQKTVFAGVFHPVLVPILLAASVLLGIFVGYKPDSVSHTENLDAFATTYGLQAPDLSNYVLAEADE